MWRRTLALGLSLAVFACTQAAEQRPHGQARPPPNVNIDTAHPMRNIPHSFFGLGLEFYDILNYTGRGSSPDPVFVQLVRNLEAAAGGPLVFRIGGNSTDDSWWDPGGAPAPPGITYDIDRSWLAAVAAATAAAHARLIVGVNLGLDDPGLAVTWAKATTSGLRQDSIEALEIGNEPNFFPEHGYGAGRTARPATYTFDQYLAEYDSYASALRQALGTGVRLAGPAILSPAWMSNLPGYLKSEAGKVDIVTYHQYPLSVCGKKPGQADYPTIPELLSDQASHGLAAEVTPFVQEAMAAGLPLRVDEVNSVVCFGAPAVSDTFASALWMADVLFEYAAAGVAGVNVQTITKAHYTPFLVKPEVVVNPDYYGLLLAADAMPPGAQLLPTHSSIPGNVKAWATLDRKGAVRLVVLNKDSQASGQVELHLSGCRGATLMRLQAPSLDARQGVSLGGQTFSGTTDGKLGGVARSEQIGRGDGDYSFSLPAASGALLTVPCRS